MSVPVPARHVNVDLDSEEFRNYISNPLGYVTALVSKDSGDFEWHPAQLQWLGLTGHKVMNKCRQMGGSTVLAAAEFAHAQLIGDDFAHIFFSITKEEAQNKIGYIKEFMHNTPARFKREIVYETKQAIEFRNPNGTTSKIISHAQKPSRGLHGNYNFDEADYYQDFRGLYDAAMPGTRKAGGSIQVISTPSDPAGLFRELLMGTDGTSDINGVPIQKHQNFKRMVVNWWTVPFYCNNIEEAVKRAPHMSTQERVYRYGTNMIKSAFQDSRALEIFQQEYECGFLEVESRYFTHDSLKHSAFRNPSEIFEEDQSLHWNQEVDPKIIETDTYNFMFPMERFLVDNRISLSTYGNPDDSSDLTAIENLKLAVKQGHIKGTLVCGIDIGSTGHATDITICEEVSVNGQYYLIERFYVTKTKWSLPEQQQWISTHILDALPIRAMGIDTNGIGMQLGQALYELNPNVVIEMPMRVSNLDRIFFSLKEALEGNRLALSSDRNRMDNIYNVRRSTSSLNNSIWEIRKTRDSHCDSAVSVGICTALFLECYRSMGGTVKPFDTYKEKMPYEHSSLILAPNRSIVSHNQRVDFAQERAVRRGKVGLSNLIGQTKIRR